MNPKLNHSQVPNECTNAEQSPTRGLASNLVKVCNKPKKEHSLRTRPKDRWSALEAYYEEKQEGRL